MRKPRKRWTAEEEAVLFRYAKAYSGNFHKCFIMVSEHLTDAGNQRSVSAVQSHWYKKSCHKPSVKKTSLWNKLKRFFSL